jgi:uncharacterized protein
MSGADRVSSPVADFEATVVVGDGTRLSVGLRVPEEAYRGAAGRVPVILDCHPYRKDDIFSFRGMGLYEGFNERGFATARLDVRGTGRSGGSTPSAEYSRVEIDDAVSVIEWLADQTWCNGSVGMWGISWSANNTLLVAARQPPALKACIALHPADELFASDIHFIDGLLHYDLYELSIDLLNGVTPGPEFPLDEETLANRFDQPPWMATWLSHQRNDGYWRERSLAPRWNRIRCPVFLVGGWYDGYHECVFRLLQYLDVPVEAWVGPWGHVLPDLGGPGAPAAWVEAACAWWDRWLRTVAPERAEGPLRRVRLFQRHWHPPAPSCESIPGTWRTFETWPPAEAGARSFDLEPGRLVAAGSAEAPEAVSASPSPSCLVVESPPWIGGEVGHWWGDVAEDQAGLDEHCATFDSEPVLEPLELLGAPAVSLTLSAAEGVHLFVRLEDLSPDGRVTLVTGRALRAPASSLEVTELLHWTSWRFEPGHRVRLALSTALWPMFWPARTAGPLEVHLTEPARLTLPLGPVQEGTVGTSPGDPLASSRGDPADVPTTALQQPAPVWKALGEGSRHEFTWSTSSESDLGFATVRSTHGLVYGVSGEREVEAWAVGSASLEVSLPGRLVTWRVTTRLESRDGNYDFQFQRDLHENEKRLRTRSWTYGIPRRA